MQWCLELSCGNSTQQRVLPAAHEKELVVEMGLDLKLQEAFHSAFTGCPCEEPRPHPVSAISTVPNSATGVTTAWQSGVSGGAELQLVPQLSLEQAVFRIHIGSVCIVAH